MTARKSRERRSAWCLPTTKDSNWNMWKLCRKPPLNLQPGRYNSWHMSRREWSARCLKNSGPSTSDSRRRIILSSGKEIFNFLIPKFKFFFFFHQTKIRIKLCVAGKCHHQGVGVDGRWDGEGEKLEFSQRSLHQIDLGQLEVSNRHNLHLLTDRWSERRLRDLRHIFLQNYSAAALAQSWVLRVLQSGRRRILGLKWRKN